MAVRCRLRSSETGKALVALRLQVVGRQPSRAVAEMVERREAGQRPASGSLGLLPSGPDPVGEGYVRRQPPARIILRMSPRYQPMRYCAAFVHSARCTLAHAVLNIAA